MFFHHTPTSQYRCANCGDRLQLPGGELPRVERVAASGAPTLRVLRWHGIEVHRCPIWPAGPSAACRRA
jgi:hypothetical protein